MIKVSDYTRTLIVTVIFTVLFNIPILWLKANLINASFSLIIKHILVLFPFTLVLFHILLQFSFTRNILLLFLFGASGLSNYFIYNFKKCFDTGVLVDVLTVDAHLTAGYLNYHAFLFVVISLIIGYVIKIVFIVDVPRVHNRKLRLIRNLKNIFIAVLLILVSLSAVKFNLRAYNATLSNYIPHNVAYSFYEFFAKYKKHLDASKNRIDYTTKYPFTYKPKSTEPLNVVLIIGESMRGDLLHINNKNNPENTPRLEKIKNLISFSNAKSSSTSTRISIPYMLTPAVPDNFDEALGSKGLPTYFKHVGFETSWFGNQGIFGTFEASFAQIALETDNLSIMKDLCQYNSTSKPYDGDILPILNNHFKKSMGNQFIIIHLMGSHWNFDDRYPKQQFEKFTPVCHELNRTSCKLEDMINTYHNTIYYSDHVISEIIKLLEDKNAVMIYASDHGYSLGERGILGNAYVEKINIPQEQLDIGMFFWASDKYIQNNPEIWNKVFDEKDKEINHNYIFHSALDCTNIHSEFIDKLLSICKFK